MLSLTWSNKRVGGARITKRFDKFLIFESFLNEIIKIK
jgi:hypothetical protein